MSKLFDDMFYSRQELECMNFKSLGENVLIDRLTPIYRPEKISIGNNVRIGSFCILSGDITIGNYVHIASYSFLNGSSGIDIGDFVAISSFVRILTENSDFSGESFATPMIDINYRNDIILKTKIKKHVVIGSGSLILPGCHLEDGVAVGAMSMINQQTESFWIYAGIPAKKIKKRKKNILELENEILNKL